jgi:hypothetical protein
VLPDTDGPTLPNVFIGDEAFEFTINMLWPFGENDLLLKKKIFNFCLCWPRQNIECTSGILTSGGFSTGF